MVIDVKKAAAGAGKHARTAAERASSNPGGRTSFVEPTLLAALALSPSHGYNLRRMIEEMTEGLVSVDLPATYRMLRRFEAEGLAGSTWIPGDSGPQRREYSLTHAGWELLADWRQFLSRQRRVCDLTTGALDAALTFADRGVSAPAHIADPIESGGGA